MNLLPSPLEQHVQVFVDTQALQLRGFTELTLSVPRDAKTVRAHAYGMDILGVWVNQQPASFDLRPYACTALPHSLAKGPYSDGKEAVAAVADHSFYQYRGALEKECDPEVTITLPDLTSATDCNPAANVVDASQQEEQHEDPDKPTQSKPQATTNGDAAAGEDTNVGTEAGPTPPPTLTEASQPDNALSGEAEPMDVDPPATASKDVKAEPEGSGNGDAPRASLTPPDDPADNACAAAEGPGTEVPPAPGSNVAGGSKIAGASTAAAPPVEAGDPNSLRVVVKIKYVVSDPRCGMQFCGKYGFTNNQVRRARAWFPCVDTPSAACPFTLAVTVDKSELAVASGKLLKHVWCDGGRKKTFHYALHMPTPPHNIALAVGPFSVQSGPSSTPPPAARGAPPVTRHPDSAATIITHFCPQSHAAHLANTVKFYHLPFQLFETYLGSKFPYGTLQQVFVPEECCVSSAYVAATCSIISTEVMYSSNVLEASIESRLVLVRALAAQWFGCFIRPKKAADAWLISALAAHLEDTFIKKYMGRNELAYRRLKQQEAVVLCDECAMPPLSAKESVPVYSSDWGPMFGTENLDRDNVRRWKAAAVMSMLEVKCGEEAVKKVLEGIIAAATQQLADGDGPKPGARNARLLSTSSFLTELARTSGKGKKELPSFAERWIYGSGCPRIKAAFTYNRKKSAIELAIKQSGGEAFRRSAAKAFSTSQETSVMKVVVYESEGTPEYFVNLGTKPTLLEDVKVISKAGTRKGRRKSGVDEEDVGEIDKSVPEQGSRVPILWVYLDTVGNWLGAPLVVQHQDSMIATQLDKSKDVQQQHAALEAIAAKPITQMGVTYLKKCMESSTLFCRLRVQAALLLGRSASQATNMSGMNELVKFYKSRVYDGDSGKLKCTRVDDVAEYVVNRSLPCALANVRDMLGFTPNKVVDLLMDYLEWNENYGNSYDDGYMLASFVEAVGNLRVRHTSTLMCLLAQLDRYLMRDQVLPSFHHVVSCAALRAITQLCVSCAATASAVDSVRATLRAFAEGKHEMGVKEVATDCLLRLMMSNKGWEAAVGEALEWVEKDTHPRIRHTAMDSLLAAANRTDDSSDLPPPVSMSLLRRIHRLLGCFDDALLRHQAFVLLQRMSGGAPHLYRQPEEEEQTAFAGPAISMDTTVRRLPTMSGPAHSVDSASKLRLKLSLGVKRKITLTTGALGPTKSEVTVGAMGVLGGPEIQSRERPHTSPKLEAHGTMSTPNPQPSGVSAQHMARTTATPPPEDEALLVPESSHDGLHKPPRHPEVTRSEGGHRIKPPRLSLPEIQSDVISDRTAVPQEEKRQPKIKPPRRPLTDSLADAIPVSTDVAPDMQKSRVRIKPPRVSMVPASHAEDVIGLDEAAPRVSSVREGSSQGEGREDNERKKHRVTNASDSAATDKDQRRSQNTKGGSESDAGRGEERKQRQKLRLVSEGPARPAHDSRRMEGEKDLSDGEIAEVRVKNVSDKDKDKEERGKKFSEKDNEERRKGIRIKPPRVAGGLNTPIRDLRGGVGSNVPHAALDPGGGGMFDTARPASGSHVGVSPAHGGPPGDKQVAASVSEIKRGLKDAKGMQRKEQPTVPVVEREDTLEAVLAAVDRVIQQNTAQIVTQPKGVDDAAQQAKKKMRKDKKEKKREWRVSFGVLGDAHAPPPSPPPPAPPAASLAHAPGPPAGAVPGKESEGDIERRMLAAVDAVLAGRGPPTDAPPSGRGSTRPPAPSQPTPPHVPSGRPQFRKQAVNRSPSPQVWDERRRAPSPFDVPHRGRQPDRGPFPSPFGPGAHRRPEARGPSPLPLDAGAHRKPKERGPSPTPFDAGAHRKAMERGPSPSPFDGGAQRKAGGWGAPGSSRGPSPVHRMSDNPPPRRPSPAPQRPADLAKPQHVKMKVKMKMPAQRPVRGPEASPPPPPRPEARENVPKDVPQRAAPRTQQQPPRVPLVSHPPQGEVIESARSTGLKIKLSWAAGQQAGAQVGGVSSPAASSLKPHKVKRMREGETPEERAARKRLKKEKKEKKQKDKDKQRDAQQGMAGE